MKASGDSRWADFMVKSELLRVSQVHEQRRVAAELGVDTARRDLLLELHRDESGVRRSAARSLHADEQLNLVLSPLDDDDFIKYLNERVDPTGLILSQLSFSYMLRHIVETLSRIRLYQLTPIECRKPGSPTPNPELERHGGNLPALVQYMQRRQPDAWKATMQTMRQIVPSLQSIDPEFTAERRLTLSSSKRARAAAGRQQKCQMGPSRAWPSYYSL